jgi:hypothetical protein
MLIGLRGFVALAVLQVLVGSSARADDEIALQDEPRTVLDRFLGTWDTEASIRRLLPTQQEVTTRGRGECVATLGGRYYEFRTETPGVGKEPGESELQVMTYDADQHAYRQWVFSSDGYHHEATGTWNPATSTLRWTGKSGDNSFVIDDRFVGSDKLIWTLTRTNSKGQTVQTITGTLIKVAQP